MILRPVIVYGHTSRLFVSSLSSSIGPMEHGEGVAFRFHGDGAWVVPLTELKAIVQEAEIEQARTAQRTVPHRARELIAKALVDASINLQQAYSHAVTIGDLSLAADVKAIAMSVMTAVGRNTHNRDEHTEIAS